MLQQKIRHSFRRIAKPFLWLGYRVYLSKDRWYTYDGLRIKVNRSVFHPGLLHSSKILTQFALRQSINSAKVLELGAGSGLLALACSRLGANVTATDINPSAITSMEESQKINQLPLKIIQSDLFDKLQGERFDFIFNNPPFYAAEPKNERERAFYCGVNHNYFQKLFTQLPNHVHPASKVFIILTDDCDIEAISNIGDGWQFKMELVEEHRRLAERLFIFQLQQLVK